LEIAARDMSKIKQASLILNSFSMTSHKVPPKV
jgi:hypothetical protein